MGWRIETKFNWMENNQSASEKTQESAAKCSSGLQYAMRKNVFDNILLIIIELETNLLGYTFNND